MKADNIYTKAALAGYIDEDTNTVTAEMVEFYLDDLVYDFIDFMDKAHDYRPGKVEALEALKEFDGDFEYAAGWVLDIMDDFDHEADAVRTYWHMAMRS